MKCVVRALLLSPALASASPAEAACSAHGAACAAQPPTLLQTQQQLDRSLAGSGKPPAVKEGLVPAYVAPPGVSLEQTLEARKGRQTLGNVRQHQAVHALAASVSDLDMESFELMKQLRRSGFTCPGGQYFPPNSRELEFDCRLWQASMGHSQDMGARNFFAHVTPEGSDPFDRSAAQGLPTFSENIASGVATAAGTFEQWKKSDGHCKNMMKDSHNRFAVAYAYTESSTYKHYWTQMFATDDEEVYRSCYSSQTDPGTGSSGGGSGSGGGAGSGGSGGGGSAGGCQDVDQGCADYGASACAASSQYRPYMEGNCAKFCGFCSSGGGSSGGGNSGGGGRACKDEDQGCATYDPSSCDASSSYRPYMEGNCKKFCGFCR